MSNLDIARAWKDAAYANSLSDANFPPHPAGELTQPDQGDSIATGKDCTAGFDAIGLPSEFTCCEPLD